MSRTEAHVLADLDGIDPREWDSLHDPGDHHASYRLLRVCRDARIEDARYHYVLIREGRRLVAAAALTRLTVSLDLLAPRAVRLLARSARVALPRFLRIPVLFCGLPVSFGGSSLRLSPDADPERVLPVLVRAMEEVAEAEETTLLCFKEHTDAERARLDVLSSLGYFRAPSLPGFSLAIEWPTFDDYVAAMRAGYRRQLRATLAARRAGGLTLRTVHDWSSECPRIHALYEQVMDRAEFQLERLPLAFFTRLAEEMGCDARALLLERDGSLEAAAVLLDGCGMVTFLLAGIDYERNRTDRAYQNLVAEVVAEAIHSGARRLELGQTSMALKSRLGGVPAARWIYLKHRGGLRHAALRRVSPWLFPNPAVPVRHVFSACGAKANGR
ncbi:MAG: GNAT family N-acetyltransferase [Bacteroidota bacterium]